MREGNGVPNSITCKLLQPVQRQEREKREKKAGEGRVRRVRERREGNGVDPHVYLYIFLRIAYESINQN